MSNSDVFSQMTVVYQAILSMFGDLVEMITGNPLVYVPVIIGLLGGLIMFALGITRRLGIRGISSGGRRRGRR